MLIAALFFGVLAVAAIVLVWSAGPIATVYANRKLLTLPGYYGSVERIEFSVWRGRGEISGALFAARGSSAPPIAQVQRLGFDLSWAKLLRGQVSIAIEVESARVQVEGNAGSKKTSLPKEPMGGVSEATRESAHRWQEQLYAAFPFEITQIVVRASELTYRDLQADPPLEFQLSALEIDVVGLSNRWVESDDGLPARLGLQGNLTGNGRVRLLVRADPWAMQPRFEARLQIENVAVPAWNALLREAIKADVVAGQFGCSAEVSAAGGEYWGYVKPVVRDLAFKELPEEPETGWKKWRRRLMTWAVAFLGRGRRQKIATKIPFSGNFKETKVDVWTAVENLLRNAFIRGLREGLEGALTRF